MANEPSNSPPQSMNEVSQRKRKRTTRSNEEYQQREDGSTLTEPITVNDNEEARFRSPVYDPKDDDWKESPNKPSVPKKSVGRKPAWMTYSLEKLQEEFVKQKEELTISQNKCKELRKNRAADRQEWQAETTLRKNTQNQLYGALQAREALRHEMLRQKAGFEKILEQQEVQFAKIEKDFLEKTKQRSNPTMPDNVVRDKFRALTERLKEWVKYWRREDFTEDLVQPLTDRFLNYTAQSNHAMRMPLQGLVKKMGAHTTRILGYAFMSRRMVIKFFGNPGWLFETFPNGKVIASAFEDFLRRFADVHTEDTLTWRSQTNQLLRLHVLDQTSGTEAGSQLLRNFCASYAEKCISAMSDDLLRPLKKEDYLQRHQELTEIFIEAAILSIQLFSQKSIIELHGEKQLCSTKFTIKSDLFEPYDGMGLEEDDIDNVFEGHNIQFVLGLAVVARGNAKGQYLESSKVWSKAVVLNYEELMSDHFAHENDESSSIEARPALRPEPKLHLPNEEHLSKRFEMHDPNLAPSRHAQSMMAAGMSTKFSGTTDTVMTSSKVWVGALSTVDVDSDRTESTKYSRQSTGNGKHASQTNLHRYSQPVQKAPSNHTILPAQQIDFPATTQDKRSGGNIHPNLSFIKREKNRKAHRRRKRKRTSKAKQKSRGQEASQARLQILTQTMRQIYGKANEEDMHINDGIRETMGVA